MKKISTKERSCSAACRLGIAACFLLLFMGSAWAVWHKVDHSPEHDTVLQAERFSGYAETVMTSEKADGLASLGTGLSFLKSLWNREEAPCYDTSFTSFMASREGICIPSYSDPVVWEDDPRYTVQDNGCGTQIFRTKVKKGDSVGSLFRAWLGKDELNEAVKAVSSVFKLNRLRLGRVFSVERNTKDGTVSRLMYDIDEESRLVLCRGEKGFSAAVNVYQFDVKLVRVSGRVEGTLFDAMTASGESSALALQLADVFSHQVDFVNEVQAGDSFDVVVEKRFLEGNFRGYGDIVAARFVNDGVTFEAFRFFDDEGTAHYYAADGSSLETQFLKAPLNFTRISSGYTLHRRHPVFGKVRPHQGVDYAAPRGTPVKALGDGEVTFVGWKRGYGKSVGIQHAGAVETHYAHLSKYAKSLKKGDKVEQGQVIGYVGATGTATGPHLDFRVRKNGKFIDPLKLTGNRASPIPFEKKPFFEKQMHRARLMLDGQVILAGM